MPDKHSLAALDSVLKPMARSMFREQLEYALAPIFSTAEQRADAKQRVLEMSDAEIDERMAAWHAHLATFCQECGRPYELTITTIEERDAALAAIRAYDIAHGRIAPAEWDHVHRVKPDEQGTGV